MLKRVSSSEKTMHKTAQKDTEMKNMERMQRHRRQNEKIQHTYNGSWRKVEEKDWGRGQIQGDIRQNFVDLEQNMSSLFEDTH